MKMSEQPVIRVLDFSNVGLTPQQIMNTIQFSSPVGDDLDVPEQAPSRARTEPAFAIGQSQFSGHALGRTRRSVPEVPNENVSNIIVSATGSINRYFVLKKGMKSLFNPMTLDEFYDKPCPPGCTRIFKQLVTGRYSMTLQSQLLVCHPFHKLRKHITALTSDTDFKNPPSGFTFKINNSPNTTGREELKQDWTKFTQIRYQMLRLVNAFLFKKTMKKMMVIPNYISMEDPSPGNCIEWPDIESRCSYRIHGDTLLNSMKMYLYHSEYGFPEPLWPKNPTTNAPFTYGQLIHVIYQLYEWCGRNRKAVPYIITKFQEAKYCLQALIVKNRPELTLYACRELFTEINQPDAIEMWLDMIEEYAILYPSMTRDELEDEIPLWLTSLSNEKAFHQEEALDFLKQWSSIIPDLVQYSRFKYFNRSDWTNIITVKNLVKTLWAKTYHLIRRFSQTRKPPVPPLPLPPLPSPDEENMEDNLLPPALDNTSVLSAEAMANIQVLLGSLVPSHSNLNFQISSEWSSILDESSPHTAGPSAVELEYNMMMFNPPVLPRLIQLDFTSPLDPSAPSAPSASTDAAPAPAPAPAPSTDVADAADGLSESFEDVD